MTSPERVRSLGAYKRLIADVMRIEQRPLSIDEIWDEIGCMTIVPMKRQMFERHLETELGFELDESKTHVKLCSRNMDILERSI